VSFFSFSPFFCFRVFSLLASSTLLVRLSPFCFSFVFLLLPSIKLKKSS